MQAFLLLGLVMSGKFQVILLLQFDMPDHTYWAICLRYKKTDCRTIYFTFGYVGNYMKDDDVYMMPWVNLGAFQLCCSSSTSIGVAKDT